MVNVSVAKDFTKVPWARYYSDWPFSWEEFYEEVLKIKYIESIEEWTKLMIDLDGTLWYPSSFPSEAFGRLYVNYWEEKIWDKIEIKSDENPFLIDIIRKEVIQYKNRKNDS
jgi:hypothetical protein